MTTATEIKLWRWQYSSKIYAAWWEVFGWLNMLVLFAVSCLFSRRERVKFESPKLSSVAMVLQYLSKNEPYFLCFRRCDPRGSRWTNAIRQCKHLTLEIHRGLFLQILSEATHLHSLFAAHITQFIQFLLCNVHTQAIKRPFIVVCHLLCT